MRTSAAVCLVLAAVLSVLALCTFAGRTVAREFLSVRQTAETTVVAWIERVLPEKTSSQKYKQELTRTRDRLNSIEAERKMLETRVAELDKQRAKQGWGSMVIANTSNLVSAALVILATIFGFLSYRLERTPKRKKRSAPLRSERYSDRMNPPFDARLG